MADSTGTAPDENADDAAIPEAIAEDLPPDADIVTVADLSQELDGLIDHAESVHHDYVLGDISDPSTSSGGHCYFTLEGEDCQLQCVAFSFRQSSLSTEPDDDMRALVEGDLEYYAPHGKLSLQVTDVHEVGDGSYAQVYRQTKAALTEDGLFDADRKQDLPRLPRTIGIVTSKHGDAVDDAIQSIHDRYPGIDIEIAHASVQGDNAVETIVSNVARLDEDPSIELIVVTRGGGADSTLRTFNELAVCHEIARTETPIAVGIGHENDETLADRVADERLMTPTDAGTLVPDRAVLEDRCDQLADRLASAYGSVVGTELTQYDRALDQSATSAIETTLRDRSTALEEAYSALAERHLTTYRSQLAAVTDRRLQTRLYELETGLEQAFETFEREREHVARIESVKADARREAEQAIATRERVYQATIVVLALALLAVLGVTFVV